MRKYRLLLLAGVIGVCGVGTRTSEAQQPFSGPPVAGSYTDEAPLVYEGQGMAPGGYDAGYGGCSADCGGCDAGCGDCGPQFGWRFNRKDSCDGGCHCSIEGLDPWANCSCEGSYNYPVPPLYTYHWPGMYKQQLMTDYHSPWRFPPLKPYTDEPLDVIPPEFTRDYGDPDYVVPDIDSGASLRQLSPVQPAAAHEHAPQSRRLGHNEPVSRKIDRYFR